MSNKAFSGFRREYVRTSTADNLDFLQKFTPTNDADAATKKYVDDTAAATTPARGPDTAVQYNDAGAMAGDANFTFVVGTGTLTASNIAATTNLNCANVTATGNARASTVNATGAATSTSAAAGTSFLATTANVTGAVSATQAVAASGAFQAANLTATSTFANTAGDVVASNVLVGPGPADASASFTMNSTSQGLKMPNMTTAQRTAIAAPEGLMVFDTDLSLMFVYQNGAWADTRDFDYVDSAIHVTFTFPASQFVGTGNTIVFPTQVSRKGLNISYDTGTGVFTLAANRTYLLQANVHIFGSNQAILFFRINGGADLGGGAKTVITPVSLAVDQSSGGTVLLLYSTGGSSEEVVLYDNFSSGSVFIQPGSHVVIYEL